MAKTIDWVELRVPQACKVVRFYERVFGWKVLEERSVQGSPVVIMDMGANSTPADRRRVGIWQRQGDAPKVAVYVTVEDLPSILKLIVKEGGRVTVPVTDWGFALMAEFEDPAGTCLALFQARPRVPNRA
jgi:predicted enzyme related to lactoylglutathione lyase